MKLDVTGISFAYNSHPVIEDMNFSLQSGQIMSVLGVNGAGKSTLLKCMNRILKPHQGAVLLNGEDLLAMSRNEVARRMGYVPQTRQSTGMTVFETVLMGRKPHIRWAMTKSDYEHVENIIQEIGISHLAMRPVSELSGGEAQKVVIARALAQSPKVLLLDEPTSNLDLKNQLEVMHLIRNVIAEQGLAAVVAIHDLNIALRFTDNLLFLKNHRIHSITDRDSLDAETIKQVYGVEVALKKVGNHTVVVPL